MVFFKAYIATLIPFVILDAIWLSLFAPTFYKKHIGHIMAKNPNWGAAIIFYLIFIAGLVIFVTFQESSTAQAAIRGAVFGFVCYATYDLTNHATLEGWPITVTVVDLCWGALLCAFTGVFSVIIQKYF